MWPEVVKEMRRAPLNAEVSFTDKVVSLFSQGHIRL